MSSPFGNITLELWGAHIRHTHEFVAVGPSETLMKDVIRYQVPFGVLGLIADYLMVKNDIQKIFAFRKTEIEKILRPTK